MSKSQQIKEEYAHLIREFNSEPDSFKAELILRKIDALYGSAQDKKPSGNYFNISDSRAQAICNVGGDVMKDSERIKSYSHTLIELGDYSPPQPSLVGSDGKIVKTSWLRRLIYMLRGE